MLKLDFIKFSLVLIIERGKSCMQFNCTLELDPKTIFSGRVQIFKNLMGVFANIVPEGSLS